MRAWRWLYRVHVLVDSCSLRPLLASHTLPPTRPRPRACAARLSALAVLRPRRSAWVSLAPTVPQTASLLLAGGRRALVTLPKQGPFRKITCACPIGARHRVLVLTGERTLADRRRWTVVLCTPMHSDAVPRSYG